MQHILFSTPTAHRTSETGALTGAQPPEIVMRTRQTRLSEASPAHPLGGPDVDILGRQLDGLQSEHQHAELWQATHLGAGMSMALHAAAVMGSTLCIEEPSTGLPVDMDLQGEAIQGPTEAAIFVLPSFRRL